MTRAYLDTSAFVKTIVREAESERLAAWLRASAERVSSELLRAEAGRAAHRYGPEARRRLNAALETIGLIAVDRTILDAAADLELEVRTLDAIHLASALALGGDLGVVVTYDLRMARAASALGLPTIAP